jgi:hypothetical protein
MAKPNRLSSDVTAYFNKGLAAKIYGTKSGYNSAESKLEGACRESYSRATAH